MKNILKSITAIIIGWSVISSCGSKASHSSNQITHKKASPPIIYKAEHNKQSGATVVRNGKVIAGGENTTTESGLDVSQKRSLSSFSSIHTQGALDVTLIQSAKYEAFIFGDENILKVLKTDVRGGKLEIFTSGNTFTSGSPKIEIHSPDISTISMEGATKLNTENYMFGALSIHTQGASKVKLVGKAQQLSLKTEGASKLDLKGLFATSVFISSSGASKISAHASKSASITAKGASFIKLYGKGTLIRKNLYDGAEIEKY